MMLTLAILPLVALALAVLLNLLDARRAIHGIWAPLSTAVAIITSATCCITALCQLFAK